MLLLDGHGITDSAAKRTASASNKRERGAHSNVLDAASPYPQQWCQRGSKKKVSESAGTAMPQPSALVAVLGLVFVARRAFISVPGGTI